MARKSGASFDGFLAEQGILEECEEQAIQQILADQIRVAARMGENFGERGGGCGPPTTP